ncbi:MAG: UDP-N-acetylglucosamine 1-carboxyvinyltransferase [Anaerolineaceae bacterium 4572_5.2]|nr:MAG: UDP-N-acetylglucosamine 1-carboxyvinyltransferase [Anaerolineaceae bacterium 4572_5.2]
MSKFIIEGKQTLAGEYTPSGNKNAAFPVLSAALLTDEPVTLRNIPNIGDIRTMITLLEDLGVEVTRHSAHDVTLRAGKLNKTQPDPALFSQIRGALVLMGSMLAREGKISLSTPGGDQIGRRRIDTHLLALEALGAKVSYNGEFTLTAPQLRGAEHLLDEASVTGTENTILAAVTAQGTTILRNAASEPHVQELCLMLNQMGAQIEGIASNLLTIRGVDHLRGAEFTLGPDYLEVGSIISLAAVTNSRILIKNAAPEHMKMPLLVFDKLGVNPIIQGKDILVESGQPLKIKPDFGGMIPQIEDAPWPAFPTDMMSVALVLATQSDGTVLMHEKMFETRLYWVDKLIGMGARIILCDPHRAVVQGPSPLHAEAQGISSPDIRAGMALLIAALAAEGTSTIHNIRQIDRGYERIEEKLAQLGAKIKRVA